MAEVSGSGEVRRADDVGRGPKMSPRHIVALVIVVLLVIVALQNLDDQQLDILFWDVTMPLVVLIAVFGLGGFLVGWLVRGRKEKRERGGSND
jgi:uncharacterized integral membrane protein